MLEPAGRAVGTLCLALRPAGSGAAAQGARVEGVQARRGRGRPERPRQGPGADSGCRRGRIWKASLASTNQGSEAKQSRSERRQPGCSPSEGGGASGAPFSSQPRAPDGLGEGASLLPSQDTLALCNSQEVAGFLKTETSVCSVPEPAPGGCWGLGQKQSSASRPTPAALWHQEAGFTPDSKRAPTPTRRPPRPGPRSHPFLGFLG